MRNTLFFLLIGCTGNANQPEMDMATTGADLNAPDLNRNDLPDLADPAAASTLVPVGSFKIEASEVIVAQYALCVSAGACTAADSRWYPGTNPLLPVVGVTFDQANTYCTWRGRRLPNITEWQIAAGRDTFPDGGIGLYPWGDASPSCALANIGGCSGKLEPPGSHPDGDSPAGVHDLIGNVEEWIMEAAGNPYQGIRGGSFTDTVTETIDHSLDEIPAVDVAFFRGFRCASN